MTHLAKRLRASFEGVSLCGKCAEAADEIERLQMGADGDAQIIEEQERVIERLSRKEKYLYKALHFFTDLEEANNWLYGREKAADLASKTLEQI